ncbi:MAG: nuclear transport factor 2 family protein [Bacteroidetes bacterium]|nr:nuclear transport factor 2 family protein [Bacteroidota bacterium]MBS1757657.1 nuclear transport factor 2 family protein [Bacteroidota bacterium]
MKKLFALMAFAFLFTMAKAQSNAALQINAALQQQLQAWNTGDINAFMQTYWQSDSLMFIGKSGVTYGWQNTLNNYKKGYPDTAAMGKLDFTIIETKRLSALYYFVVGKWHLTRSIGNIGGSFTLLFRKVKNKWLIVADHSS